MELRAKDWPARFEFTETRHLAAAEVTAAYLKTIHGLRERANYAPWKGFGPGECVFLGASGDRRDPEHWEIRFKFRAYAVPQDHDRGDFGLLGLGG